MKSEPQVCHGPDTPDHIEPERSSGMIALVLVLRCLWFICDLLTLLKMYFLSPYLQVV